jgi:hypothetical protein
VAALQDRGHVLVFQPSAAEVHRKAAEWFKDEEIYAWFGKNLHRMVEPSFRHYVRAGELKAAGMVWTEVLKRTTAARGWQRRSWPAISTRRRWTRYEGKDPKACPRSWAKTSR